MEPVNVAAQIMAEQASTEHVIRELPVLVVLPHNRCNCRCMMCDIWKIRQVREITAADLEPHLASLRELKVQWVVFSGGEPLLHSDFSSLARLLRGEGIRTTLLTAALTLEKHAARVAEDLDDIIVSLDGPREIHDLIRGVPHAYRRLERGINALRQHRASMPIHGRCTVQKQNFRHLRATVRAAQELNLDSLSFLAADLTSEAFNHVVPMPADTMSKIALDATEVDCLCAELDGLVRDYPQSNFIRESPEKLRRIGLHFRAHLGQSSPVAPRCNAPWVSAVIESDGAVRPCFFHRPFGNIRQKSLIDVLNSQEAVNFRSQLAVAENPICQRCVCSLFLAGRTVSPTGADAKAARRIPAANFRSN